MIMSEAFPESFGSAILCGEDIANEDLLDILWLETGTLDSSYMKMLVQLGREEYLGT